MFASTTNLRPKDRNLPQADPDFDSVVLLAPLSGEDGDTTSADLSSNSHSLTFSANAALDSDIRKFGFTSCLFDGDGDYVQVANDTSLQLGSSDFTIECHIRFNGTPTATGNPATHNGVWLSKWTNTGTREWVMGWRSDGNVYWTYSTNGTNGVDTSFGAWSPVGDTWYHVAVCRNGNDTLFFIDGTQFGSTGSMTGATIASTTSPVYISGYFQNGSAIQEEFDGWIENVRITKGVARYTAAFTPPERAYPTIKEIPSTPQPAWANVIYQTNFEGTDGAVIAQADDKDATNWTSGGTVQPVYDDAVTKFGTTSARYNGGSNGFMGVAADGSGLEDINTQDFMVEGFYNYESISGDRAFAGVWHSSTSRQWRWFWDQSAGTMVFGATTNGSIATETQVSVSWTPSTSVWYHAAVSRESNTLKFFIDGVQIGSNQTFNVDIFYDSVRSFLMGTNNDGNAVFDGWCESPRFVIGEAVYTSNFNPPTQHHPIGS